MAKSKKDVMVTGDRSATGATEVVFGDGAGGI
jgi:hypothetical protein